MSAEAPWREKNDELTRYRNERQNAENDAGFQVGIYRSSLSEIETKHQLCQGYVPLPPPFLR
jgi:DNA repair protein RAD50